MSIIHNVISGSSVLTFLHGCCGTFIQKLGRQKSFAFSDPVHHDLQIGGFVMRHCVLTHLRASPPRLVNVSGLFAFPIICLKLCKIPAFSYLLKNIL